VASEAGHEAQHVARMGKAGWQDWNIAQHAREGDFVLVTNNEIDFVPLYAEAPLHAGLVIITPSVTRPLQKQLFQVALEVLAVTGEPINSVLKVSLEAETMTIERYELGRGLEG
jgi:predicted nuclease of predicted toxin-antitoxin system